IAHKSRSEALTFKAEWHAKMTDEIVFHHGTTMVASYSHECAYHSECGDPWLKERHWVSIGEGTPGRRLQRRRCSTRVRRRRTICLLCEATSGRAGSGCAVRYSISDNWIPTHNDLRKSKRACLLAGDNLLKF